MKEVKKTSEYTVLQRRDGRYAVQDSNKSPVNGDEKVKILVAEGLVTVAVAAAPEPEAEAPTEEAPAEDAPAEEAGDSKEEKSE